MPCIPLMGGLLRKECLAQKSSATDTNLKENENPLVLLDNCFRTLAIVHDRSETLGPMLHDRFETGSPCMTVLKP